MTTNQAACWAVDNNPVSCLVVANKPEGSFLVVDNNLEVSCLVVDNNLEGGLLGAFF